MLIYRIMIYEVFKIFIYFSIRLIHMLAHNYSIHHNAVLMVTFNGMQNFLIPEEKTQSYRLSGLLYK